MAEPFPVEAVANWFLQKAESEGRTLDPMKLQKLIYFANGWHLTLTGNPLVNEYFEAWQHGPVVPGLYHNLKHFGGGPIKGRASAYIGATGASGSPTIPPDSYIVPLLERIWQIYGKFSGIQLSNITHRDGGAWQRTREQTRGIRNADIPLDYIKQDFDKYRAESQARQQAAATHGASG